MNKLLLLVIMMATWIVVSCGTTDGTTGPGALGFYENKKSIKGNSLIFTSTSQWHCINENKKWLDKSCD